MVPWVFARLILRHNIGSISRKFLFFRAQYVWRQERLLIKREINRLRKLRQLKMENPMPISRNMVDTTKFNKNAILPYELRAQDFQLAMHDVYDFFYDVNLHLSGKGLQRLDDMLRPAIMSGLL